MKAKWKIGDEFETQEVTGRKRWRVTDVGSRVVVAVCLSNYPDDDSWFQGPPYPACEQVFDEFDQESII